MFDHEKDRYGLNHPKNRGAHTHNCIKRYYYFCKSPISVLVTSLPLQVTMERDYILTLISNILSYPLRVLHRQIRSTEGKSWNPWGTEAQQCCTPQPKQVHLFGREFLPISLAGFWLPHLKDVEVDNAFGSNAPRYHPRLESNQKKVMFTKQKHC